ncbi:50S ribosomal protein L5, partial [Salmonella sp. NW245]
MKNIEDTNTTIDAQKSYNLIAKKTGSANKVREGMPVGVRVTLRGENMYNFFDRLVSIALPRVKDFRGVPRNGFDGRGNYNFGLQEQLIFPEISYDSIMQIHGMNITIVTSADSDKAAFTLLEKMGMPFSKGS